MSRIHAQSVLHERVLCPYCGQSVLWFHDCPSLGGKVGFRYIQSDEKLSQIRRLQGLLFAYQLVAGASLLFGVLSWRPGGVIFVGIGLLILIRGAIGYLRRAQEVRDGLVAIVEGPISRLWEDSDPEGGDDYNIEVLGQTHEIDNEVWNTLKEGDTVRIHQLPRSNELLRIERIARGSKGRSSSRPWAASCAAFGASGRQGRFRLGSP